uniref:Glycogen [starch] synthase n=1 Tax=Ditylenchus dipsaci TaxID=166011 RepID=A0A915DFE9_9BILA
MSRLWKLGVATVFTTHATLLGRHLCASGRDLYNNLSKFDCDREAGNLQIYHRYCLERAAANMAHVFTTVSEITGLESEFLLKRKPDILTPNGLNVVKFAALHEFQNLHATNKEKIHDFIRGHFYGHMNFDLDKTLYMFTAGRYEFSNKGGDFFIEALARLNHMLKSSNDQRVKDVIGRIHHLSRKCQQLQCGLTERRLCANSSRHHCKNKRKLGNRMFDACVRGHIPDMEELSDSLPPICTHNMVDDANDLVLNAFRKCHLFNNEHDRVKVIFHPEFLSSVSPLIAGYEDLWGKINMMCDRNLECTVMGIPSVTSNLSGFGCFIEKQVPDHDTYGIFIVDRNHKDWMNPFTSFLSNFSVIVLCLAVNE